jgi:hypothetical protein
MTERFVELARLDLPAREDPKAIGGGKTRWT